MPGPDAILPDMVLSTTRYCPAVEQFEFNAVAPDPEIMAAITLGLVSGLLLKVKASQTLTVTYMVVPGRGLVVDSPKIITVGLWALATKGRIKIQKAPTVRIGVLNLFRKP